MRRNVSPSSTYSGMGVLPDARYTLYSRARSRQTQRYSAALASARASCRARMGETFSRSRMGSAAGR
ncbi:hypothetical protein [Deinococcus sp.]|uniref:hypothetical protein n=1 Tax=Deinococcus sp. TaxID=47478 RepID=UPI00286E8BC9|nr:hypothetical protein [Deinococcus sp.]